jgi:hypothetical protein
MRRSPWIALIAVAAAACASSPSSSSTGTGTAATPAPAAQPTTSTAAATGGANPCATGQCKITLQFDQSISGELSRKQANYKVYKGCPRAHGVTPSGNPATSATGFRPIPPLMSSPVPLISLPAFDGTTATVAFWMGTTPDKFAVANFASGTTVVIKLPYAFSASGGSGALSGSQLIHDDAIDRTNDTNNRRACR